MKLIIYAVLVLSAFAASGALELGQEIAKLLPNLSSGDHVVWEYDLNRVETLQADFEAFVAENGLVINKFVHSAGKDGQDDGNAFC